jgi:acetoin utilization protein AcuC
MPTPGSWQEYTQARTGVPAPRQMSDGSAADFTPFDSGFDPDDPIDRAIMATRSAVFPAHGLFPGL